jgi:hypothetical protein
MEPVDRGNCGRRPNSNYFIRYAETVIAQSLLEVAVIGRIGLFANGSTVQFRVHEFHRSEQTD